MKHLFSLRLSISLGWLSLVGSVAVAQPATDLIAALNQIRNQVKVVSGASQSFGQSFVYEPLRPYLVNVSVKEIDSKGQETAKQYTFNLADIDPATILFEAKKELMVLTLKTRGKQSFISQKENDTQKNNIGQLVLYGTDADNARSLADLFRKAAPLADKQFLADVRLPDTYEGLLTWIGANLDSTPASTEALQQSLEMDKNNPLLMKLAQTRTEKGKAVEQLYQFNVADINPQQVNLEVNGSVITVGLENKDRFIRSRKNGQWERNTTSAGVMCLTAYKARIMQLAWQKILPFAGKQLAARQAKFVQYASLGDGLKRLSTAVQPVDDGADHLDQLLTPTCVATLSVNSTGRKTTSETYTFRWSDLDGRLAKVRSDGGGFVLEIPTKDKVKWITTTQNDQRGAYSSSIEIKSNDIDVIRFVPALLEKLIPDCQKTIPVGPPPGGMEWVAGKITAQTDLKGQMTYQLRSLDDCSYTYTIRQNAGKSAGESSWDIKLADIDPQSVKINISGSELSIDMMTVGKTKVIKTYKDSSPGSYVGQLKLVVNDLEIARPMVDVWKQSIAGCRR